MSDPDLIEHLESEIVEDASSGHDDNSKPPLRHRMHRSAVRPFFCCGSEISLVSLMDSSEMGSTVSESSPLSNNFTSAKSGAGEKSVHSHSRRPRKRSEKLQQNKSKKKFWSLRGKFGSGRFIGAHSRNDSSRQHQSNCLCSAPRQRLVPCVGTVDLAHPQGAVSSSQLGAVLPGLRLNHSLGVPLIDISRVNFDALYPTQDFDEVQREERAREIREGLEISQQCRMQHLFRAGTRPRSSNPNSFMHHCQLPNSRSFPVLASQASSSSDYEDSVYEDTSVLCLQALAQHLPSVLHSPSTAPGTALHPVAHSQVEYIHCLVPDLARITSCSFYWGVIDRYEAETLLENKPEGTFLLRDSAQEDFLFSVSFRRYNRSLHARIEQWNHLFSFDAHDPAVFACSTVVGLIEHYKDPECCMFFEPMLTLPLHRVSCFPLKQLCRSVICSSGTMKYGDINTLPLPASLKEYLKYYHYKQKVRVKRLDLQV